ncbi:dissimilatory-type sulfite reductase subunit alpha [Inmirania thermothiophila]|uniref:Dissimilatory sulfite reductase alpha subunit n=1 Tax=Inmirania thermothiophila TaxID=1750597 RepID=A0A3N1Y4G4_9GAMM|nr:dissimilatory-type sulfite reductase subunit alpha [Inmirania thermothiophila]ROR32177.1 dissimilatory sulfite reductase alpha subunit [Inmirania thermothiophila]
MAKPMHPTPLLDELEKGPWPSFVKGLKRLAQNNDMMVDLLGQLETSYETRLGYWKGGTVGVFGYGGGVIPRFTELLDENGKPKFPEAAEFHTLRVMPPPGWHYDTATLRKFCDIWEQYGSGLIALHGQTGDIMFQGCRTENVQKAFDAINEMGFDLGGAGPALRTGMSCVGPARCEQACYDTHRANRQLINAFLDDMHRPSLPYKFKFKFSGCPNDCMNSIQRSDFAVIGTWRDDIQIDQAEVKNYIASKGRQYVIDNVVNRCPTKAISLRDDDTLEIRNKDCVRCMHCINVMTKALSPGKDRGVTILIGGKRTLKIGDLMGTVIIPFMKLETEEDWQRLEEFAGRVIEFFAENALEHERTGEMIERIGLANFLEGVGVDPDPNMINHPRTNPYVRLDGWAEEAKKWEERKAKAAG